MLPDRAPLEDHRHHEMRHIRGPQTRKSLESGKLYGLIRFPQTIAERLDYRLCRDRKLSEDLGSRNPQLEVVRTQ
ncbi:MAG: hypothetical protein CMJ91_05315 [Planctomycetes bacterium]|nr:hypothetical protein [Planctomycetota bacterium]